MELDFKGRPDGLGNIIGELIMLTTHSHKNNIIFNYYWNNNNNNRNDRKYPILLKCKNINITNKIINSRPSLNISNNLNEKLECSKNIKPLFNIYFKNNIITMEKQNNMVADAQPGSWLESCFIHIDELL